MEHLRFSSELKNLKTVRDWVRRVCRQWGLDWEQTNDMCVAVCEAFTNCVKHGYDYKRDGTIMLSAVSDENHGQIHIRDEGKSIEPEAIPEPDLSVANEGGYGVFLMKRLADKVDVLQIDPKGTEIVLTKRLGTEKSGSDEEQG